MAKQVRYQTVGASIRKSKRKADSKKEKLDHVIAIVSEMSEAKLDAVILLLDPPADDGYVFTEQDKLEVNERTERYERGIDKGIPAEQVLKEMRQALKHVRKK